MADYVIKKGDTLSAIAQANKTTVDALAKANQIADPNKIIAGATLRLPGADINANEIKDGAPVIEPPITPAKDATDANAILEYTQKEQERIAKEKQAAQTSMGATAGGYAGLIEEAKKRPTIDVETKREQEMAESGATEKGKELDLQTIKTATIKGEIDGLKLSEQTEIDNLEKSGVTRGAIDREKEVIQRKYASQLAKKTSQFNIEAAMLSAMEGNYTRAKGLADEAVQDYTYDYQQNVKTFDTLFSLHADWISALDKDEQNVLKTAANEAQNELDKVTADKTKVSEYMMEWNAYGAGITLDDSLEEAQKKVTKANTTRVAQEKATKETTGGMSEDELYSVLQGVEDYLKVNPDKSPMEAISSLPTEQRTAVLNAYYLNKAFQEEQIFKPKTDALSTISGGDISETSIQNAISAGATNEEILNASGDKQAQATEILGKISSKTRGESLYRAGKTIGTAIEESKKALNKPLEESMSETGEDISNFLKGIENTFSPFFQGLSNK
jgi:LysM repeat protein